MDTVPPRRPGKRPDPAAPLPTAWSGPAPALPPLPGGDAATRWTQPPGPAPSPLLVPRLVPGLQLGPWRLEAELGRGGMGQVWRATDLALGREVALKVLLDLAGRGPDARARFLREGQLAARVSHPGIVRIYAVGEAPVPWLACELIRGARPLTRAAEGRPRDEALALLIEAARALGYAHAHGVVHRDVKPDNLLVGDDGRVHVSDFGISTALDLERLTATGRVMGTPAYMAPEQIEGDRAAHGPWTDVWALGVVLYELLTGELPFGGASPMELVARVLQGRGDAERSPRTLRPDVSPALEAVVLRALAFEPGGRWRDGEAFAEALELALAPPARRGRRGRRAWPLPAGAALAAALAAALVVGWRARPPDAPPPPLPRPPAPIAAPAPPAPLPASEPADVARVWSTTVAISWDGREPDHHRDLHVVWQEGVRRTPSELAFTRPGVSTVQLRFYLEGEPTWAWLHVHHIATEREGQPLAWVALDVNERRLEARFLPRVNDSFDVSRWIRPGENSLTVSLHPDSGTVYWFRRLELRYGAGGPP